MSEVKRSRFVFFVALAAAVLLPSVAVRPTDAGDMPSRRYRDPNAKFSFRVFDDWDPVPLETQGKGFSFGTEKYLVTKYMQRGADKRGLQAAQLFAFRMGKGTAGQSSGGETTPGDTKPEDDEFMKKIRELMGKDEPKTMKELLEKSGENYGFKIVLDAKTGKDLKSKDGVLGRMWAMDRSSDQYAPPIPYFHVFASWKKEEMELGLWMWCPIEAKKKLEQGFPAVAKSFMFFDPQAEDVKSLDVLNDLPISPRKRKEIERGIVKGWAVMVSPKKNYIIIYNTKNNRNNLLAKIISDRIERIREQIYETKFPPAKKIEAISIVRICGDRSEYHAYGGPGGSAGYWSNDTEELVFYDASPQKEPDDDTLAVLYHEAFHQYIYYSVGEVSPHSWFNEGTGDYFAGAKYGGGKFSIKPFNWRLGVIQTAIRKGACECEEREKSADDDEPGFKCDRSSEGYTPLKVFVRFTQREYYSYPSICYAQGWSLIYFLREGVPKNPKMNEKWGKILDTYFDVLKREANKDKPLTPKAVPVDPGMGEPGMDDTGGDAPAPDDPGMGDPGMGDPGMGDPGMGDPGMGDPGMGDPGMGDPGMGDPGMGDPGMDDPAPEGGDDPGIPTVFSRMFSSGRALKVALEEAFKGVDFAELEAAWKAYTLKVH